MLPLRSLAWLVAALTMVGACASESDSTGPSPIERQWQIEAITVDGQPVDLANSQMTVEFNEAAASIDIRTTCNRVLGSFAFDGVATLPDLAVGAGQVSLTLPGTSANDCDTASAEIDQIVVEVAESVDAWQLDGEQLTLGGDASTLVLVER